MINGQKIVALLPLKENSQRIKAKNFRDFAGKPLFGWVLNTLEKINIIDKIVINTDARAILLKHGFRESERITIRERPRHLIGDEVSMNLIIEDDVNAVDSDFYLMTHTTNPLLSENTILGAINSFASQSDHDSLFTVNKVPDSFLRSPCQADKP